MLGTVDEWQALELAGAFVLGTVLGALATIRLARALVALFTGAGRRRPPGPDRADDG